MAVVVHTLAWGERWRKTGSFVGARTKWAILPSNTSVSPSDMAVGVAVGAPLMVFIMRPGFERSLCLLGLTEVGRRTSAISL